ncbi:MAG: putative ABC transport system ATP-binding protein [Oleiphilaceae bacterium]|jgi:putative ABC transport system ATP-binding protein
MSQHVNQCSTEQLVYAVVAENIGKQVELNKQKLQILRGISLKIKCGESLAIVGPSGSGKTTLLGVLAGLDTATQGEITLMNKPLSHLSEDGRAAVRAEHVGFVFQSFQLLPSMTAIENVMLPLELKGDTSAKQAAEGFLARLGLGDRISHYPSQLSGGEQQRVALARAFACKPDILFADEPTGNLDQRTGQKIIDLMFEFNEAHETTLVMVTHDDSLAARCQRSVHINDGQLMPQQAHLDDLEEVVSKEGAV